MLINNKYDFWKLWYYVDPKFLSNPSNDIINTFVENYSNNNDDQTLYNKLQQLG